jgi:hypothetical protein
MLGEKTLLIIQTNFINIAVKDEKMPKRRKRPPTSWLPSPPLYSKSGGKTVNAASFKKVWLRPSRISSRKVPYRRPRAGFCGRAKKRTPLAPHSGTFNGGKGIKTIHQPFYSPNTATADLFLFQRGEVEAGRPLAVPGRPQQQKRVRRCLLGVDGPLRMIHPNRQHAGLKKS